MTKIQENTIKIFYENEAMREAVHDYINDFIRKSSLSFDFKKSNEEVGADARSLSIAKEVLNDAFNDMAQFSSKLKKVADNQAI